MSPAQTGSRPRCASRGRRTGSRGTRRLTPVEDFLPVFTEEGAHARLVEDWGREVEKRIPEKELERTKIFGTRQHPKEAA